MGLVREAKRTRPNMGKGYPYFQTAHFYFAIDEMGVASFKAPLNCHSETNSKETMLVMLGFFEGVSFLHFRFHVKLLSFLLVLRE